MKCDCGNILRSEIIFLTNYLKQICIFNGRNQDDFAYSGYVNLYNLCDVCNFQHLFVTHHIVNAKNKNLVDSLQHVSL